LPHSSYYSTTLHQPPPRFTLCPYTTLFRSLYPQNQAFVEEAGDAYGTDSESLVFSGPFTMTDWDGTGLTWSLVKNEDYYNADKIDRKSTRLNSSHVSISYAVFCLKKKKNHN